MSSFEASSWMDMKQKFFIKIWKNCKIVENFFFLQKLIATISAKDDESACYLT